MGKSRRKFLKNGTMTAAGLTLGGLLCRNAFGKPYDSQILNGGRNIGGPFKPTEASLKQYQCPDWFRDAKFGIWAVWRPQSVPQQGDWYARHMYEEGSDYYKYHLAHYGHPSNVSFKEVIPHWKAENWAPDKLMSRYKKAGAKYFCLIAMHHDNFDCFNPAYQKRFNSVQTGPKRDIAGEWQQAAKRHGMHFGMTEHLAPSWWFYSASKGADKKGPMAGVPYDGINADYADLYWRGNEHVEGHYYIPDPPEFVKKIWSNRINSIVDRYHPDLLYSDTLLPYPDDYGRQLVCNLYSDSIERHNGKLEVVYNCKEASQGKWVEDLERGVANDINPNPWQADTCIGDWYYKRSLFDEHKYKTTKTVIHMLSDIVSKNGNLLLNLPLLPDGSLDNDELQILDELSQWMPINGEAIFATRSWKIYGEGASTSNGAAFDEGKLTYSPFEIRFTTKADALYVIALGWPNSGKITVNALSSAAGEIGKISVLGHHGKLDWEQTDQSLVINLPDKKPCDFTFSFKVEGLKSLCS